MTMYVLPLLTLKDAIYYLVSRRSKGDYFMGNGSTFFLASWNSRFCICVLIVYLCIYRYTQTHTNNFCLWQLSLTNKNHQQNTDLNTIRPPIPTGTTSQTRAINQYASAEQILKVAELVTVVPDFMISEWDSWKFHIQSQNTPSPSHTLDCVLKNI